MGVESVEQRLRELAEIQRPFSHPFPATEGDTYFIDNTFAFRIFNLYSAGRHVTFAADMQLQIFREHAKKDREERRGVGIGQLVLTFAPSEGAYLGDKYKFSLSEGQDYFKLESVSPINFEPVPKNADLKELLAQKTSTTNI